MENKQKPSSGLTLFSDHHFAGDGVDFHHEMLTWPIHQELENVRVSPEIEKAYRYILAGLSSLCATAPYEIRISLGAVPESSSLRLSKRAWAMILLDGQILLTFSHHTKKENSPFFTPFEWPELEKPNQHAALEWGPMDWGRFFRERLLERAAHLMRKSKKMQNEALELQTSAANLVGCVKQFYKGAVAAELREALGMTQQHLADLSKLSLKDIESHEEKAKRLTPAQDIRLAIALGTDAMTLQRLSYSKSNFIRDHQKF